MVAVEKKAKTVEGAVALALEELQITEDKVNIEIIEEPKKSLFGMFGGKPAVVRVVVKEEAPVSAVAEAVPEVPVAAAVVKEKKPAPAAQTVVAAEPVKEKDPADTEKAVSAAKVFLQEVFKSMKMEIVMERFYNKNDESTVLKLHGPGMGILIGKHGQTLDALQYLTNLVANKHSQERVRIVVDVEDYRERRKETLVRLAQRLADKVRRSGEKVVLEPMNPYERKIIHMTLQNDRKLITYSEGEEPNRKTVIALKNN